MRVSDEPGVIVLGCGHGGLAVLRSLARHNRRLLMVTDRRDDIALASRVGAERMLLPAGLDHEQVVDHLLSLSRSWDGSLVLETEDRYSEALSRRWDDLDERFVLACQPHDTVKWFLDKSLTHELARSVGVPVPAQQVLSSADDVDTVEPDWFPAIVKPCSSHEFTSAFGDKLWVVASRCELRTAFRRASAHGISVVLHELIPGSDRGTLESVEIYINRDGTCGPEHFNVKLRQSPPGFGVMRAGRAVAPIDDIRVSARSLLAAVNYRGFASAEFKRDPRDGVAKLIEVNVRLPRNLQLMITSGVDFPWVMYEDLVLDRPSASIVAAPTTFVDIVADVSTTLSRDRTTMLNPKEWLSPYLSHDMVDAVWSRHDIGPFRQLLVNRGRKALRRGLPQHRRTQAPDDARWRPRGWTHSRTHDGAMTTTAQLPTGMALVCGCNHGGLAVARSLGRRGVRVAAVTANPAEAGLRSRYLMETAICPDPADPAAFARYLLDHADRWRGALLFETNDVYATAIAEFRDELAEHYRISAPPRDIVELFLEKNRTYDLAERIGVPFPSLIEPQTIAELDDAIGDMTFPVMVKPVRSHEFAARYGLKLIVVEEPGELRARVAEALQAGIEVMVCEIVPGSDYRTLHKLWLYIDESGTVLAEVHNVKLRQTPPMFGISRVAATIPPNEEMRELAMRIVEASGLTGTAGFEFKLDPRDGRLKLIEVNVRMMADVQLMISAGVDIPWIMYRHVVHGISAPPPTYRTDQMWIYLVADVRRFVTDRDPASVRAFLEPYLSRHRSYAYWSWRDPRPFCAQIVGKFQRAWARRRGQQPDERRPSDTDVL